MAEATATDLFKTLKDAAYVAVGFGVIAFQKTQVRRRELEKQFATSTVQFREQLAKVAGEVEERFEPVVETIEAQLDQLEGILPEQARTAFHTARTTAKDAGDQLRARVADLYKTDVTKTATAAA